MSLTLRPPQILLTSRELLAGKGMAVLPEWSTFELRDLIHVGLKVACLVNIEFHVKEGKLFE